MNTTDDLRNSLTEHVLEPAGSQIGTHERMAQVRRRRRGVRRVRALGVLVGVGSVATAAVLVAGNLDQRPDTAPSPPSATEDVQPEPVQPEARRDAGFPTTLDGDQLIEARIGKRGQSRLNWTWTPSTLDVMFAEHCSLVGEGSRDDTVDVQYVVEVNGVLLFRSTACSDGPREFLGDSVSMEPDTWREDYQVRVGEPAEVSVFIADRATRGFRPLERDDVRLGLAVYGSNGETADVGGVQQPVLTQHEGVDYRLDRWVSAPLRQAGTLSYDLPVTDGQPLVVVGAEMSRPIGASDDAHQFVESTGGLLERQHLYGCCSSLRVVGRSDGSQSVTITELNDAVLDGTLYVLVYEPVD